MMPVRLEDQDEYDINVHTNNAHNEHHHNNNNDESDAKFHSQMNRRSNSERRHYRDKSSSTSNGRISSQYRRNESKDSITLNKTTSSVDSGAGAEDDESGSHTASEEINTNNDQKLHLVRHTSDLGDSDRPRSSTSSLRRKTSSKRSKSQSAGDRLARQHITTSDSAVSTSVLSTSGLSTPTESRIFSSPNLSDHSKTSFSPKHSNSNNSNIYPPLTKALRKKQERLKRELDLKETRYQIERQRFMAETYRSHRVGSFKRRDSSKGSSSGNGNSHRTLQKSYSVDPSAMSSSRRATETASPSSPRSKRNDERKLRREHRSKSLERNETENDAGAVSQRNKDENSKKSHSISHDNNNLIPTASQTSIHTTTSSTSKTSAADAGDPLSSAANIDNDNEIDNDSNNVNNNNTNNNNNSNNNYTHGEKKQKRKSRKDRSSSSRRKRHESQESTNDPADKMSRSRAAAEDNKVSTDSDDAFESMAKKLQVTTAEVTHEDFEKRMNQAVDSILRDGMPDIPSTEQITETGLLDWRAVFRVEMMRLRREVNEFRAYCQNQIVSQASFIGKLVPQTTDTTSEKADESEKQKESNPSPIVADQLRDLQANMKLFQKKQQLLDLETELLSQEERLAEKQNHLEEYEKEILEVESMLNHRQAICDRRQKTLLNLDEELQSLRTELEETREQMHVDGSIPESNSERARKNWDMLKRNLMDEQKLLETTVQKYRSELASATSTIAGKDILISRLQSVSMQHEEEIGARDRRIKQLESKLSIALSETKSLLDQLPSASQLNLNASKSALDSEMGSNPHQRPGSSSDGSSINPENSQRLTPFRSTRSYYRRPSSNATNDQADDNHYTRHRRGSGNGGGAAGGTDGGLANGGDAGVAARNSFRTSASARKRNSVSDNAISRLTLSTPRTEGTSTACVVQ